MYVIFGRISQLPSHVYFDEEDMGSDRFIDVRFADKTKYKITASPLFKLKERNKLSMRWPRISGDGGGMRSPWPDVPRIRVNAYISAQRMPGNPGASYRQDVIENRSSSEGSQGIRNVCLSS